MYRTAGILGKTLAAVPAALAAVLWAFPAGFAAAADPALPPASLQVSLDHLRPGVPLRVELYRDAASWSRQRDAAAAREVRSPGVSETVTFEHLPPGRYAVSARQLPESRNAGEVLLLGLARHGDSGGGNGLLPASFDRAAQSIGSDDPVVQLHLYTDTQY